ncbi:MAG: hypothetical protein AB8G15_07325 [Saprospiraceae bacterium]
METILYRKHLLLIGGTEKTRQQAITALIEKTNFETFRFPKGMKDIDTYVNFVQKKKLFTPWYEKKGKYGINQVLDFHRDWISKNHALVVLEEFQEMEEASKLDLLASYLNEVAHRKKDQKVIHLIISQATEDGLIDQLSKIIKPSLTGKRTNNQVVQGSIEVIAIN